MKICKSCYLKSIRAKLNTCTYNQFTTYMYFASTPRETKHLHLESPIPNDLGRTDSNWVTTYLLARVWSDGDRDIYERSANMVWWLRAKQRAKAPFTIHTHPSNLRKINSNQKKNQLSWWIILLSFCLQSTTSSPRNKFFFFRFHNSSKTFAKQPEIRSSKLDFKFTLHT